MEAFDGYLISRLTMVGTRSEGIAYYLQTGDEPGSEREIRKRYDSPWGQDPSLHAFLNQKVTILGADDGRYITYEGIRQQDWEQELGLLEIGLSVEPPVVQIDLSYDNPRQRWIELTATVRWPHEKPWISFSPTTQLYDFALSFGNAPKGRWSEGRDFIARPQQVRLIGDKTYTCVESWRLEPGFSFTEGVYTAEFHYIPAAQWAACEFEVKVQRIQRRRKKG